MYTTYNIPIMICMQHTRYNIQHTTYNIQQRGDGSRKIQWLPSYPLDWGSPSRSHQPSYSPSPWRSFQHSYQFWSRCACATRPLHAVAARKLQKAAGLAQKVRTYAYNIWHTTCPYRIYGITYDIQHAPYRIYDIQLCDTEDISWGVR